MLIVDDLQRVFRFKLNDNPMELDDPDPTMTEDEVLAFYSSAYPMLTTAKVVGPTFKDDKVVYQFISTIGTKG